MAAYLIVILFTASALFAVTAMHRSWRRYGSTLLAIRHELKHCNEWRDVHVTVRGMQVHPAGARIFRPDFTGRGRYPQKAHALPAAA